MTFLNFILLGGAAAFSIPLIIHLFHRSRFRVIRWGAMHLLDTVVRTNKKRLQLEQLILLLIRCAIPILLAVCMARPVLTGLRALLGAAKTSMVILLDNSYSMDVGEAGRSGFMQARETAGKILANLPRGSEASVILLAGGVSPVLDEPTFSLGRLEEELARLESGYGMADLPAGLELAAALQSQLHHAHRELVLISDFQKVNWTDREESARARVAGLLRDAPVTPLVTFVRTGREEKNNLSVDSLEFSRFLLGAGQRVQVRAHLKNHGSTAFPDLRVCFRVDGAERAMSQISLGPGEAGQVLFTHTFEAPGSHVVAVDADAADALPSDNSYQFSVPVWDRVPVLVVDGDPQPEPLRSETDFLQIALRPYHSGRRELTDLIESRVVNVTGLDPAALAGAKVVVLANVAQLSDRQVQALEEFVRHGGGLVVFPGSRISSTWYNHKLDAGGQGLLPAPVVAVRGSLDAAAAPATIVAQHYEHPALTMFNDPRNGNLAEGQIRLWYRLGERAAGTVGPDPDLLVLARLNTGDPFLVEKKYGEGRVMLCSAPCDADWSNLPMRPFYLPLMQQVVTYLASKVFPPRNVDVGRPLIAFLPADQAGQTVALTDPAGEKHELAAVDKGGRAVAEYARTKRPGLYLMESAGDEPIHFVVNTSRAESDLELAGTEQLAGLAKGFDARVVRSWDEYRQLEQERRFGRELWRPLLWAVLALLFAELVLEQLFARRKP